MKITIPLVYRLAFNSSFRRLSAAGRRLHYLARRLHYFGRPGGVVLREMELPSSRPPALQTSLYAFGVHNVAGVKGLLERLKFATWSHTFSVNSRRAYSSRPGAAREGEFGGQDVVDLTSCWAEGPAN